MPSIVFVTQKQNRDPLRPNHVQEWVDFAGPQSEKGAFLISAFALHTTGPQQSDTVRVEDIRVETTRDRKGDPTHRLHFQVRNVGSSTIRRYVVNVWHVLP